VVTVEACRIFRRWFGSARSGNTDTMATYRVIDPKGDVVETREIDAADDAHAWFVDVRADNSELGWRMEVEHDGEWSFFDDTEGVSKQ
jgi:hypothetical protein